MLRLRDDTSPHLPHQRQFCQSSLLIVPTITRTGIIGPFDGHSSGLGQTEQKHKFIHSLNSIRTKCMDAKPWYNRFTPALPFLLWDHVLSPSPTLPAPFHLLVPFIPPLLSGHCPPLAIDNTPRNTANKMRQGHDTHIKIHLSCFLDMKTQWRLGMSPPPPILAFHTLTPPQARSARNVSWSSPPAMTCSSPCSTKAMPLSASGVHMRPQLAASEACCVGQSPSPLSPFAQPVLCARRLIILLQYSRDRQYPPDQGHGRQPTRRLAKNTP